MLILQSGEKSFPNAKSHSPLQIKYYWGYVLEWIQIKISLKRYILVFIL